MNRQIVERTLEFYDIQPIKIYDQQSGYRNKSYRVTTHDNGDLNLIFFKPEPNILRRINAADEVSDFVATHGLPVRQRFNMQTLKLSGKSERVRYVRIYKYLPGVTIPWEQYTKKHIKLLGWAMSDLHFTLKNFDGDLPDALSQCSEQLKVMQNYFLGEGVRNAMRRKLNLALDPSVLEVLENNLEKIEKLPKTPLHLDLVRGNVLYNHNEENNTPWQIRDIKLTGLIDFEKVAYGPAILDLARTYAFLIVDCAHKTPEKIFKYLIVSGYNKCGKNQINLPSPELTPIFWTLVKFFLSYDFYKFLRHNPYEYLAENHHFCLTRNILIQKNMLKYSQERK